MPGAALSDQGTWGVPRLLLFQVGWGYQLPRSGKYLPPTSGLPAQDAILAIFTIPASMGEEGSFPLYTPEAELPNTEPSIPVKEEAGRPRSKAPAQPYSAC